MWMFLGWDLVGLQRLTPPMLGSGFALPAAPDSPAIAAVASGGASLPVMLSPEDTWPWRNQQESPRTDLPMDLHGTSPFWTRPELRSSTYYDALAGDQVWQGLPSPSSATNFGAVVPVRC